MTDLRTAAQAVIDRWDSPKWKETAHTAVFIQALRIALVEQAPNDSRIKHDRLQNENAKLLLALSRIKSNEWGGSDKETVEMMTLEAASALARHKERTE